MKAHILVVEDDAEIREGVSIYLKNQGYAVHKAANGKEGLEVLAQQNISLAIVDVIIIQNPLCPWSFWPAWQATCAATNGFWPWREANRSSRARRAIV